MYLLYQSFNNKLSGTKLIITMPPVQGQRRSMPSCALVVAKKVVNVDTPGTGRQAVRSVDQVIYIKYNLSEIKIV